MGLKKKKQENPPEDNELKISFFQIFRYGTCLEVFATFLGIFISAISGGGVAYNLIQIGELSTAFVERTSFQEEMSSYLPLLSLFGGGERLINATYEQNMAALVKDATAMVIGSFISIGISLLCCTVAVALISWSALRQITTIRMKFLKAVLRQDMAWFDTDNEFNLASKMSENLMKLKDGMSDKLAVVGNLVGTSIISIAVAIPLGWELALACMTVMPFSVAASVYLSNYQTKSSTRELESYSQAGKHAEEILKSIKTVAAFGGEDKEVKRYRDLLEPAEQYGRRRGLYTGVGNGFNWVLTYCLNAIGLVYGIRLVLDDREKPEEERRYVVGIVFSVLFNVYMATQSITLCVPHVEVFAAARGAAASIFYLLEREPLIDSLSSLGVSPRRVVGNISLEDVHFSYPSRPDVKVLKGFSLNIKAGECVALVGSSGCGKSTVLQLLQRLYDPDVGSVKLDGKELRNLNIGWLRSSLGVVGQEPVLFHGTIFENICIACPEATLPEVQRVAAMAYAHEFISKLPKGYDTVIGERGASLSGGQKQRIAIARALVRKPHLLLLDEATSALDTASEARVQLALDKAAEGRTTVVVAHRLSTIRRVGLIYVMDSGEVVETGTHDELMAKKGHYYNMVVLQEPENIEVREDHALRREESKASENDGPEVLAEPLEYETRAKVTHLSFWSVLEMKSKEWKWMALGTLCSIIIGFSMPLFIVVFGDLFGSMSDPDPNKLMEKVEKVSIVCIFIGLIMGTSNLIEALSFGVAGAHLTERLRTRMFEHLLQQHVGFFDDQSNSTGALCAKLSSEAAYVQSATGQRIGICLQGFGSIGLALILAMVYEYRVGLVALSFLPLIVFIVYQQIKATKQESFGNAMALENSTKIAIEAVSNMRTVVCLGQEQMFVREYVRQLAPALKGAKRAAHCRGLVNGLSRSIFNFINATALTYGGQLIVSEGVRYEDILVTTQSLQMASGQAQNAFTFAPEFQKGVSAASRIVELLNSKPQIYDPMVPLVSPFRSKGEASFEAVQFKYPTRPDVRVLRGLDLKVERGKTIALVGRSGCGKSTITQLLQRFYDPDVGSVCLDGFPLPGLWLSDARSCFGLVSQEPVLFDYSIADNISYGDYAHSPLPADIVTAAMQANIHNFIMTLPQGYATNIGSKGMQLSGGQKQRVAIARALIRRPKILLLDEATSALDTESEKVVQDALDAAKAGRTCVTIAHRLSTIRDADLICVIAKGRVAEAGTHQQLLDTKGLYYDLHAHAN